MRTLRLTALIILILDQVTKYLVVHHMELQRVGAIDFWDPFLNFRMAWNEGVNFGLFSSSEEVTRWALIAIAVVISLGVIWWIRRDKMGWKAQFAGGLMVGGAIGNIIDRILYGAVADFMNMSCCGIHNPWSFNIADIAIFVGAIGLVFFADNPAPKKPRARSGAKSGAKPARRVTPKLTAGAKTQPETKPKATPRAEPAKGDE